MDKMSCAILQLYNARESLSAIQLMGVFDITLVQAADYIAYLRQQDLIEIDTRITTNIDNTSKGVFPDTPLKITVTGKARLEEIRNEKKSKRNEWVRYIITTSIAVAAFIKSFFF